MFERFSEPARQVVVQAQEEARRLRHNYIGTEHLLLGLVRDPGEAGMALTRLGIRDADVRDEVARIVGWGDDTPTGQIPFTPRSKKVLELGLREALSLESDHIAPEHILLGLVRENGGVASRLLFHRGVTARRVAESLPGVSSDHSSAFSDERPKTHGSSDARTHVGGYDLFERSRMTLGMVAGLGLALGVGILLGWLIWG